MLPKNISQKKILIYASIVGVFLVVLFFILRQEKKQAEKEPLANDVDQEQSFQPETTSQQVVGVPTMTFETYQVGTTGPTLPAKVKSYTFNNKLSVSSVSIMAAKLGLTESKQEGNTVLLYNSKTEDDKRGYLKFNLDNGVYEYNSYGRQILAEGPTANGRVRNFLISLGLIDDTVVCDITYQKKSMPDFTFVECHRDWNRTGLPIINFIGLLNIPEKQTINEVQLGMVDENTMDDPDIINVSTGQNGKVRPNDFNTVTVAIDRSFNLVRINSNLKLIETAVEFDKSDFLTPAEAIDAFKNGRSSFSLIVPVDDNAAWETVFPDNTAYRLKTEISDFMLTYIENPFTSKSLTPMYLVRGTGETENGYQVKFLQTMPALKNQQTLSGEVAGLMMANAITPDPKAEESLKLGTFNPEQRAATSTTCVPAQSQLSPLLNLGEFGLLGKWTINAPSPQDTGDTGPFRWFRSGQWYLIPKDPQVLPAIESVVDAFTALSLQGRGADPRDLDALQKEWAQYSLCPLRVSGGSPTLFVYGSNGRIYDITVGAQITYAYPLGNSNGWQVVASETGLKVGEETVDSIYYEYRPVLFEKPSRGWIVNKEDLKNLADKVGQQVGLTDKETGKLAFELSLAADKIESDKLFVGPVSQLEIDAKVPLKINPKVPAARYHFYVSKSEGKVDSPALTPIERRSEMVVEVGAFTPNSPWKY